MVGMFLERHPSLNWIIKGQSMHISNHLQICLEDKKDKNKNTYHIGRLKFPGNIDFSQGVAFLIFLSEACEEELQIALLDKENTTFSQFTKQKGRLKIRLESREDSYDKTFYVAKIQFRGYVRCNKEVVFMIFTSKKGSEELQVVGDIIPLPEGATMPEPAPVPDRKGPEVLRRRTTTHYVNESFEDI